MKQSPATAGIALLAVFLFVVANFQVSAENGAGRLKRAPQMRNSIVRLGKRDEFAADADADPSSEQMATDQDMLPTEAKRPGIPVNGETLGKTWKVHNLGLRSNPPSMALKETSPSVIWKNAPLKRMFRTSYQQPIALNVDEEDVDSLNRPISWLEHMANYRHRQTSDS